MENLLYSPPFQIINSLEELFALGKFAVCKPLLLKYRPTSNNLIALFVGEEKLLVFIKTTDDAVLNCLKLMDI